MISTKLTTLHFKACVGRKGIPHSAEAICSIGGVISHCTVLHNKSTKGCLLKLARIDSVCVCVCVCVCVYPASKLPIGSYHSIWCTVDCLFKKPEH